MLEEKIRIIYSLIDIFDNGLIFKTEFEKFFNISCLQSSDTNSSLDQISIELFKKESSISLNDEIKTSIASNNLRIFFIEILTDLFHNN